MAAPRAACGLVAALAASAVSFAAATPTAPSCRNASAWPYAASSVWNTPLGASAQFSPALLFPPDGSERSAPWHVGSDGEFFVQVDDTTPLVTWFDQGHWGGPATAAAYCNVTGKAVGQIRFPADVVIGPAGSCGMGASACFGGNNPITLLQPDDDTLLFMQPAYVCEPGAPFLAILPSANEANASIRSDGTLGGHGGSGLNTFGGTIRLGELLPEAPPIAHVLKLELFAHLFYDPLENKSTCFRWPAVTCDGYAFDKSNPGFYNGSNPLVQPGSLLAVAPADAPALNASLQTVPGRKMLAALRDYGALLVDDTFWNSTSICVQVGVEDEFTAAYGFGFAVTAAAKGAAKEWYDDMLSIFRALSVVVSNAADAPGGGGAPLQPPPPPFC